MLRMRLLNGAESDLGAGDFDSWSEPWESASGDAWHGPDRCGERGARTAMP